jgi:hypothetical protein
MKRAAPRISSLRRQEGTTTLTSGDSGVTLTQSHFEGVRLSECISARYRRGSTGSLSRMPLRTIRNLLVVVALGVFVLAHPRPASADLGCNMYLELSECAELYWMGNDTNCTLCDGVLVDCGCGNTICSNLEMLVCQDGSVGFRGGDCSTETCYIA